MGGSVLWSLGSLSVLLHLDDVDHILRERHLFCRQQHVTKELVAQRWQTVVIVVPIINRSA